MSKNKKTKPNACCSVDKSNKSKGSQNGDGDKPRRTFLGMLIAGGLGACALAVPIGAGVLSILSPMRWKSQVGKFYRVAPLALLPEDGTPQKYPVVVPERKDAWTIFRNETAGKVFLRRVGKDKVEAFADICPHAGCSIDFDKKEKQYRCPCHLAYFSLEGKRLQEDSQSPRDMDRLDSVEIRDGEVWVKFEKFQVGTPQKIAES